MPSTVSFEGHPFLGGNLVPYCFPAVLSASWWWKHLSSCFRATLLGAMSAGSPVSPDSSHQCAVFTVGD